MKAKNKVIIIGFKELESFLQKSLNDQKISYVMRIKRKLPFLEKYIELEILE